MQKNMPVMKENNQLKQDVLNGVCLLRNDLNLRDMILIVKCLKKWS